MQLLPLEPLEFLTLYRSNFLAFDIFLLTFQQLVANFSAPWSGPCRSIAPTYCELANKYPSFMFLTVNVDVLAVSEKNFFNLIKLI